jgi:hypothetical protein
MHVTKKINLPDADDLDTGAATSGYTASLYLIPAEEHDGKIPAVTVHRGYGNTGTPEPAWHHRWTRIYGYGPAVSGDSLLEALTDLSDELIELAETYQGSQWDGHNHVGSWEITDGPDELSIQSHPRWGEVATYWDAGDYLATDTHGVIQETLQYDTIAAAVDTMIADADADVLLDETDLVEAITDLLREELAELAERNLDGDLDYEGYARARKIADLLGDTGDFPEVDPARLEWVTPGELAGQIVEVSYSADGEYAWERWEDRSEDLSSPDRVMIRRIDLDTIAGTTIEPWNQAPAIASDDPDWEWVMIVRSEEAL